VNVHDLGPDALAQMIPVDLAQLTQPPSSPIGEFSFHGCTCGIGCFSGQPPWECHPAGDELLHVLAGVVRLSLLERGEEVAVTLEAGALAIVPQGIWHRSTAPEGVTILYVTPSEGSEHSWDDPHVDSNDDG
jgi:mannose-6-phosphate isomerase-like protein (cupin superfamily)